MSVIRWEEPPEASWGKWKRTAEALRERPGEWALVAEGLPEQTAYRSVKRCLQRHGCEAKVVKVDGVGHGVWARFPTPPLVSLPSTR